MAAPATRTCARVARSSSSRAPWGGGDLTDVDGVHGEPDEKPPEERLLWAVMDRALDDLLLRSSHAHEAWTWLFTPRGDVAPAWSLEWVCEWLELDPVEWRDGLRARGLGAEPVRVVAERVLTPGIGKGAWVHPGERACEACGALFCALRVCGGGEKYCVPCRKLRPHKRRWAA